VVEQALTGLGVGVEQAALAPGGHRHADRVRDALAERPAGDLDAGRVVDLGVPGGERAPLPEVGEVLQREAVAGQVELGVQRDAGVPAREHEAVASGPARRCRVVPQQTVEQQERGGCQAHRRAGVTGAGGLDGVHRQGAGSVDGAPVEVGPVQ
jgi:hypothetical protein